MSENFFHYHDDTIFHGVPQNPKGFSFKEARSLINDEDKILKLKERLAGYYVSGLNDLSHPFTISILTCVGIEVLGQVFLGFDSKGNTVENNTIKVYEMLDPKMAEQLSAAFKTTYNINRNIAPQSTDFTLDLPCYARVVRKGLRNAFTHTYRSLGVVLSDSLSSLMYVDENIGYIIINPFLFRQKFLECYEECFDKAIANSDLNYRQNSLKYFDLLVK